jgi:hypothetical protein
MSVSVASWQTVVSWHSFMSAEFGFSHSRCVVSTVSVENEKEEKKEKEENEKKKK